LPRAGADMESSLLDVEKCQRWVPWPDA
jgi:hypothetical protein